MKLARLCLVVLFSLSTLVAPLHAGWWPWSKKKAPEQQKLPPLKDRITAVITQIFTDQKQVIFDAVHPIGTAKSVKVHEVIIKWKGDKESENENDVLKIDVRYTVYWDGPIQKDGYTKMNSSYDAESERWSGGVLATSGVTKDDVGSAIGFAVGAAIGAKMQEAGASQ